MKTHPTAARASLSLLFAIAACPAGAAATGSGTVTGNFTYWEGDIANVSVTRPDGTVGPGTPIEWARVNGRDVPNNLPDNFVDVPGLGTYRDLRGSLFLPNGVTTTVSWGLKLTINPKPDPVNVLSFAPASFAGVAVGQAFRLGTISITNGSWLPSSQFVGLNVVTQSADPTFDKHSFFDLLEYHTTANIGTPQQTADYLTFVGHPELGQVRVYESFDSPTGSNTGSVELWGKIGSLTPLYFANPSGGVFLQPVPEPTPLALVLAGLGAVALVLRTRRPDRA